MTPIYSSSPIETDCLETGCLKTGNIERKLFKFTGLFVKRQERDWRYMKLVSVLSLI